MQKTLHSWEHEARGPGVPTRSLVLSSRSCSLSNQLWDRVWALFSLAGDFFFGGGSTCGGHPGVALGRRG